MPVSYTHLPDEIKKIQIADIACGSGIFLEEAYQFLVDYCTEWYMQNDPEHLLELSNGKKKLPLTDKKDILTKCIYGVDIDVHAVEVSKFSLLIKLIAVSYTHLDVYKRQILDSKKNLKKNI